MYDHGALWPVAQHGRQPLPNKRPTASGSHAVSTKMPNTYLINSHSKTVAVLSEKIKMKKNSDHKHTHHSVGNKPKLYLMVTLLYN